MSPSGSATLPGMESLVQGETLEQLLTIQWKGSLHADLDNYARIDKFLLRSDVPMHEKRRALNFLLHRNAKDMVGDTTSLEVREYVRKLPKHYQAQLK